LNSNSVLWNAAGMTSGLPYLDYNDVIPAGQSAVLAAEYYVTNWNLMPTPTVAVQALGTTSAPEVSGAAITIDRTLRLANGDYLLEFSSQTNRVYYLQYSRTGLGDWKTVVPPLVGTGRRLQWIDVGPPQTEVAPASVTNRFYRVFVQP
jgi:hypothetical protein